MTTYQKLVLGLLVALLLLQAVLLACACAYAADVCDLVKELLDTLRGARR